MLPLRVLGGVFWECYTDFSLWLSLVDSGQGFKRGKMFSTAMLSGAVEIPIALSVSDIAVRLKGKCSWHCI